MPGLWALLALGLTLAGCDTNPYRWDAGVEEIINESLAKDVKAAGAKAVPAEVTRGAVAVSRRRRRAGRARRAAFRSVGEQCPGAAGAAQHG
ncbi:MAG: hypothetical protein MZV65_20450 [Chromatiales bacterium]|nr:hypothetical protein [Chromatiales bacterium]